jgi:hypothetical protein
MVHDSKKLAGARKAKLPAFVAPQLATRNFGEGTGGIISSTPKVSLDV